MSEKVFKERGDWGSLMVRAVQGRNSILNDVWLKPPPHRSDLLTLLHVLGYLWLSASISGNHRTPFDVSRCRLSCVEMLRLFVQD